MIDDIYKYLVVSLLLLIYLTVVYLLNVCPKRSLRERVHLYLKTNFKLPQAFTLEKLGTQKQRGPYYGSSSFKQMFRNCYLTLSQKKKNKGTNQPGDALSVIEKIVCKDEPFAVTVDGEQVYFLSTNNNNRNQQLNSSQDQVECGKIYHEDEKGFKLTCCPQKFNCPPGWVFDVPYSKKTDKTSTSYKCVLQDVCGPNDAGYILRRPSLLGEGSNDNDPRSYVKCQYDSSQQKIVPVYKFCKGNTLFNQVDRQILPKGVKPCVSYDLCLDQMDGFVYGFSRRGASSSSSSIRKKIKVNGDDDDDDDDHGDARQDYFECVAGKSIRRTCQESNTVFSQKYKRCVGKSVCDTARQLLWRQQQKEQEHFKLVVDANNFTICASDGNNNRDIHVRCPLGVVVYPIIIDVTLSNNGSVSFGKRTTEIALLDRPNASVRCKSEQHNHIEKIDYFENRYFKQPKAVYYWTDELPGKLVSSSVTPKVVRLKEPNEIVSLLLQQQYENDDKLTGGKLPRLQYGQPLKTTFFDDLVEFSSTVVEVLNEGNIIRAREGQLVQPELSQEEALKRYCKSNCVLASLNQFVPHVYWNFQANLCDNCFYRIGEDIFRSSSSSSSSSSFFFGKARRFLNISSSHRLYEIAVGNYYYASVPNDGLVVAFYIPITVERLEERRKELATKCEPLRRKWFKQKEERKKIMGMMMMPQKIRSSSSSRRRKKKRRQNNEQEGEEEEDEESEKEKQENKASALNARGSAKVLGYCVGIDIEKSILQITTEYGLVEVSVNSKNQKEIFSQAITTTTTTTTTFTSRTIPNIDESDASRLPSVALLATTKADDDDDDDDGDYDATTVAYLAITNVQSCNRLFTSVSPKYTFYWVSKLPVFDARDGTINRDQFNETFQLQTIDGVDVSGENPPLLASDVILTSKSVQLNAIFFHED